MNDLFLDTVHCTYEFEINPDLKIKTCFDFTCEICQDRLEKLGQEMLYFE